MVSVKKCYDIFWAPKTHFFPFYDFKIPYFLNRWRKKLFCQHVFIIVIYLRNWELDAAIKWLITFSSVWNSFLRAHTLLLPFKVLVLPMLILSHITIVWFWLMASSFLLYAKKASKSLPTAHIVARKSLFSFRPDQFASAFLLKPAPFYKLFAGLSSTDKTINSLWLLLYLSLSSVIYFLPHSTLSIFTFLRLQRAPGHSRFHVSDSTEEPYRSGEMLWLSAVSWNLSSLISTISSFLFRTGSVLSLLNFSKH